MIQNLVTQEQFKEATDELKKSVSDGKTLVATAITNKGVATASDATFATMASNINSIESGEEITPNNTSPVALSANNVYKPTTSGFAIKSYSSKNKIPTDDGVSFSAGWNYMKYSGYAYYNRPSTTKSAHGTFTTSSANDQTITCGFQPTYVMVIFLSGSSIGYGTIYFNGTTKTEYFAGTSYGTNSTSKITPTSTGFTFDKVSATFANYTAYYIACE